MDDCTCSPSTDLGGHQVGGCIENILVVINERRGKFEAACVDTVAGIAQQIIKLVVVTQSDNALSL